jgi:ring-1,2-phenylacetyl-CoA epoxidase subunit PaaC
MMVSADPTFAAIAAKSEKESAYHLRHASEWVIRLGDGTAESHRRTQNAVDDLWRFTGELLEPDCAEHSLINSGILIAPDSIRAAWDSTVNSILTRAKLRRPSSNWMQLGGRSGRHTEYLGHLLEPLQHLQRSFPGAVW